MIAPERMDADRAALPVRVTRERGAELLTQYYFKISARSLERAPLAWQRLNGKAHCLTADLFAWAEGKLATAPPVIAGRQAEPEHATA